MRICKSCGGEFDSSIAREHVEVHGICEPSYCRLCSWKRKLAFANEYNVYKRKCDATGKSVVSVYGGGAPFPVYDREFWITDEWELPEMDYDEARPFMEQYLELSRQVPRPNANCVNAENSEYTHLVFDSKSCYLSFQIFMSERVIGCYRTVKLCDSVNCFFCSESELLLECANSHKSYNLKFCEDCEDCSDSAFLFDCRGCRNCFMCWNLRNSEYSFKNEKLTKEEYEKVLSRYDLSSKEGRDKARMEFESLRSKFIVKASHQINCEDCKGDYLVGCKGCDEIYFSDDCEDSADVLRGTQDVNSYDAVVGGLIELCYNVLQPGYSYKCAFGDSCNHCNYVYMSEYCDNCDECFGCISLKRGRYCILNKKYPDEEYKRLVSRIFKELNASGAAPNGGQGFEEFFDPARSPFKYEETIADLYFPESGFSGERVCEEKGKCAYCSRVLTFADAEKAIYEKMGVSLSEACFNCRIQLMSRPYSVVQMEEGKCEKCGIEVLRGKSARKFGKLHCEECYRGEVY